MKDSDAHQILCSFQFLNFQPGIKMNVDAGNHSKEGVSFFTMNFHIMQMIVIKNPVIHTF